MIRNMAVLLRNCIFRFQEIAVTQQLIRDAKHLMGSHDQDTTMLGFT